MRWVAVLLAVSLCGPAWTVPGRAEEAVQPPDADADGVTDAADACPDSPPYELVDDAGCSVCDCDEDADGEDWSSRGAYMRCVFDEIHARRLAKTLNRKQARLVVKAARKSSCGRVTDVRCCIMFPEKGTGMCKVMDELRCDEDLLGAAVVEDLGSGSCFPNPCVHE
jgi:hypothetical protein